MKFLTEKKKLFALIALICFAITLVSNLFSAGGSIIGSFEYMFDGFGRFLISAISIISSLLALLIPLCYMVAAFFVWKKDNHMKLLAIGGVCVILNMFLAFVSQIISFITYDYFNFGILLTQFFANCLPFVFAAYLIIFSLIKVKGPIVPIAGAALIALMLGSGLLGGAANFVQNIINLFDYFHWRNVWFTITSLFSSGMSLIGSAGLLLLVPAALYIPKEEVTETEEIITEEPAAEEAEEAPAAE